MKSSLPLSTSPYRVGLAYERLSLSILKSYSFHLRHTGKAGDGGQDFDGWWQLSKRSIPIVGEMEYVVDPPSLVGVSGISGTRILGEKEIKLACALGGNTSCAVDPGCGFRGGGRREM